MYHYLYTEEPWYITKTNNYYYCTYFNIKFVIQYILNYSALYTRSGPYENFKPYAYGPDRIGICLKDPTVRVWSGSFVQHLQIMLLILSNGANKS